MVLFRRLKEYIKEQFLDNPAVVAPFAGVPTAGTPLPVPSAQSLGFSGPAAGLVGLL